MMLNIKRYSLVFVLLFWCGAAAIAQQQTMNLDSVLRRISSSNPMLQSYDYRARAMDAYAEGAGSWMAPMVGGGVFMHPYPGQGEMEGRDRGMVMLSAEQEIPNPAKLRAKGKYLRSRAAIESAGKDITYNQLRAQAKTAYYNWVVLEKQMDVLQDSERIMEYMLKLARIRYPYSQGSLGSIYKAEARLHGVENMQLMISSQIAQQNVQLNILMNSPKELQFKIDTLIAIPDFAELALDSAALINARSDIRQLNRTIESMRLNVQLEQLERKPDFKVRFEHMYPKDNMMPQQFTAMGMVSIP
ncbi:MAG: TolC family protein, partial [Bacteroidota bacterium]|nr:TolC family protein [Bacteroidota bacterium]